jgi:hypothetical protein
MPKLSRADLARHRAWLSDWRTPADMADHVSAVNVAMGSADFFRQGGVEFGVTRGFVQNRTVARFAGRHSASARHRKGGWGGNCRWLALCVDAARGSSASGLPDFVHFLA